MPSADGRRFAVPTAVGKRVDTCGFYPLNSRFPLFLSLAQTRDRRPLRKGERQSGYRYVCFVKYSQFTDIVLLHRTESLSRRDITVSRNSLVGDYRQHLRIGRLVPFIFVGPVYYNALKNCAALLSPRGPSLALRAIHLVPHLRRVARMCSSTLSDTANMLRKIR